MLAVVFPIAPPPALDGFRVLEYATTARPARFSGRTHLFVGETEVGRVPRLAIAESLQTREIALVHATRAWRTIGIQSGFESRSAARQRAERMYPGITANWVKAAVTRRQAQAFEDSRWARFTCSFCGKTPPELDGSLITSRDREARICHKCVRELVTMLD